ncbi:MAG: hypothetical protein JW866_11195 [Ignavibacteriales bacterium]|nr:hypothetical protein [Ignavibacteriales bacterium]
MSDSSNYTIIHYSPICDGCISVGSNEFYNSNQYKLEDDYFQFVIIDKNDDRMTVNFKTNPGYFITYIYIRDVPFIPGIIDITEYLEYYPNDDDIMFIKIANSLWGEDCGCD